MTILVTGATGTQGNAVIRALHDLGHSVRALVRDQNSYQAQQLATLGIELITGSFEDPPSVVAAMHGADGVFSVQLAPTVDRNSERRHAQTLVEAAINAGVSHIVHSSVSNTGHFRQMQGWDEGLWERNYWESKADVERMVKDAPLAACTILRPAFMMDNFAAPKAQWMFPDLESGSIITAIAPETPLVLISADDIGRAAAAAFTRPEYFSGLTIELAADLLTPAEIAETLSHVKNTRINTITQLPDSLIARGQHQGWVQTQLWMNVVNYPARPAEMISHGLQPERFSDWAKRHQASILTPEPGQP